MNEPHTTATSPAPAAPGADLPVAATVYRRPVVTVDGHVVGYALSASVGDAHLPSQRTPSAEDRAAAERRLHDAYLALDLPNLVADRLVFLPATPQMLEGFVPTPVAPGRLVLTLPVGFENTPDAVDRALALKALGMQLALDDYTGTTAQEHLLRHVGYVVVRPGVAPLPPLVHHVHRLGVRVLAVDVPDQAAEDLCRAAGVDAVIGSQAERAVLPAPDAAPPSSAGAAPDHAETPRATVLRAGQAQCLAIMHLLHQEDVSFSQVAQVIDTDPVLTLRVLHLVNSGAFALNHAIDTVSQAIVLLGRRELEMLVAALLVDARPDAMDSLWLILARALACEVLADDSTAYTVGMLSGLAEQIGLPAEVVVEKVGVSQVVADAVVHGGGPFGPVLGAVRGHERADVSVVLTSGLDPAEVSEVYMRAVSDALATARTVTRQAA